MEVVMIDPIRIYYADDEDEVRARHERLESRFEELGVEEIRFLQANGKVPTEWDPIIRAWLAGGRLDRSKTDAA